MECLKEKTMKKIRVQIKGGWEGTDMPAYSANTISETRP
jgi:hypothetical protein